jgi:hypothetical protein
MKFLFTDFNIYESTEAAYLSHEINQHEEHESILISPRDSIYDYGDTFKPDFIISSINALSRGVIDYLEDNPHIRFILHTGKGTPLLKNLIEIENILEDKKINCVFTFNSCKPIVNHTKIPFVRISKGADIGLINKYNTALFKFNKALFVSQGTTHEDVVNFSKSHDNFHIITSLSDKEIVDIFKLERDMIPIYRSYEEIVFAGLNENIPQPFLDAIASGAKVYFIQQEIDINTVLRKLFHIENLNLNYDSADKLQDFTELRDVVLSKHTSQNRAKSFLSQLPQI